MASQVSFQAACSKVAAAAEPADELAAICFDHALLLAVHTSLVRSRDALIAQGIVEAPPKTPE